MSLRFVASDLGSPVRSPSRSRSRLRCWPRLPCSRKHQHQVLLAATAACSWAVQFRCAKLSTRRIQESRAAPPISTPMFGRFATIGAVNFGQGLANATPASTMVGCSGSTKVLPPNDIMICNGQLRQSTNDNPTGAYEAGGVTVLAMYPKQPFDFAGRTGTVSFEVSNDTQGSHGAWPEFWMTNLPVPAPFAHFDSWAALPQFGLGIRSDGYVTQWKRQSMPRRERVCRGRIGNCHKQLCRQ